MCFMNTEADWCHAANRLPALHFVPDPSYGKVRWDYVQKAVHSAGAYSSHHKSPLRSL